MTLPLVLLAIPSLLIGYFTMGPLVAGDWFGHAIYVNLTAHPAMVELAQGFHGATAMALHGLTLLPFWLAVGGVATAYYLYLVRPDLPQVIRQRSGLIYTILDEKYGFDRFNDWFFAGGSRLIGSRLWRWGDAALIDGLVVNGSARVVGWVAAQVRQLQSGYLYHYAFAMIVGVALLATAFVHF